MTALLSTHGLTSFYGDFQALYGLDLTFDQGDTIAIIGSNGAGKSTLLRTITGLLKAPPQSVLFEGQPIGGLPAAQIMQRGIAMVPEGRKLFPSLTVEENLLIGADRRKGDGPWNLESLFALFPILKERRRSPGTACRAGSSRWSQSAGR